MKTRFYSEGDDWSGHGTKITDSCKLQTIRETLEGRGLIIVQRWYYRGSSVPERLFFDEYDKFIEWLEVQTFAGDAIDVWSMAEVCLPDNVLAEGKCPNEQGLVPQRGAY